MAMGTRKVEQASLFLTVEDLPVAPKLPVFEKLNEVLNKAGFDEYVEGICRPFYAETMGRRSLPPFTSGYCCWAICWALIPSAASRCKPMTV